MRPLYTIVIVLLIAAAVFLYPFHLDGRPGVDFGASLIGLFNFLALITAVISYIQFLFPKDREEESGEYNRIPFQVFNMIFVSLFFLISLDFFVSNKEFYTGYEHMGDKEAIKKYYLSNGLSSIEDIFIASSVVVNIIYILTHLTDYYGRYKDTAGKKTTPIS